MAGHNFKTGYWDAEIVKDETTREEVEAFYADTRNVDAYNDDQMMSGSVGQDHVARKLLDLGIKKSAMILDVCGGTGRVARRLVELGYEHIDGQDGSLSMLNKAVEAGLYRNTFVQFIEPGERMSIADETYDVVVANGAFAPGHLYPECLPELLRVVKPGGYLVWARRQGYEDRSPRFAAFDDHVESMWKNKLISYLEKQEIDQYILGDPGYLYAVRKSTKRKADGKDEHENGCTSTNGARLCPGAPSS